MVLKQTVSPGTGTCWNSNKSSPLVLGSGTRAEYLLGLRQTASRVVESKELLQLKQTNSHVSDSEDLLEMKQTVSHVTGSDVILESMQTVSSVTI